MTQIDSSGEDCTPAYLEEVLAIFKRHSHPFVLVDSLAMRWMGCPIMTSQVSYIPSFIFPFLAYHVGGFEILTFVSRVFMF